MRGCDRMGMNLAYKILNSKLKEGKLIPGEQIGIQIDQTSVSYTHLIISC